MPIPERPQLRPYLAVAEDERDPRFLIVRDRLGVSRTPQRLSRLELLWLQMCNGRRTLREIQIESMRQAGHRLLPLDLLTTFLERMDRALFLDGPDYREKVANPVRPPACQGSYENDAQALRQQLRNLFTCREGPGLPARTRPDGRLRGALLPHIDYARGGPTYAWGFKEVVERTTASLFIIIATSHLSSRRFTLTRKAFATPLGVTPTDQSFIDRLVQYHGNCLFDDELAAHLPEWSIELEVVFLQYLYEGKAPIRIVPLVVGSFRDLIALPIRSAKGLEIDRTGFQQAEISRMVEALRCAETETPEPVCYLISGDLAHLGPKFGDPGLPASVLEQSRSQDQALLQELEKGDAQGFLRMVAAEADCRRICGLPPIFTALQALRPGYGRLLHYDRYCDPNGHESVSFASMGFYR
jgi:predicted class III extradiol MEMO1 family dioxygenase